MRTGADCVLFFCDVSALDRGFLLGICVLGLLAAGTARGYVQELILARYRADDLFFRASVELLCGAAFGARHKSGSQGVVKLLVVALVGVAAGAQIAMAGLSFPTATVLHVARILPEMIMMWLLFGRLYDIFDVVGFFLVMIGLIGMVFADKESVLPVSWGGIAGGVVAGACETFVLIDVKALRGRKVGLSAVQFVNYGVAGILALGVAVVRGEMQNVAKYQWDLVKLVVMDAGLSGVVTEISLFVATQFDAEVHASLVTPIELGQGVLSLCVSFFVFGHDELTLFDHAKALCAVLIGVAISLVCQLRNNNVFGPTKTD